MSSNTLIKELKEQDKMKTEREKFDDWVNELPEQRYASEYSKYWRCWQACAARVVHDLTDDEIAQVYGDATGFSLHIGHGSDIDIMGFARAIMAKTREIR